MVKSTGLRASLVLSLLLVAVVVACSSGAEPAEDTPVAAAAAAAAPAAPAAAAAPTAAPAAPTAVEPPAPTSTPVPAVRSTSPTAELIGDFTKASEFAGLMGWINSEPFTLESQRGKVVLVDFWTYTCINCIRTLPYLKDWHDKYADQGLVILGVHAPEFDFEKIRENVVDAVKEFELKYAVAQDNDFVTWRLFQGNRGVWPAKYLIDKDGFIRYTKLGEGDYAVTEEKIRELLAEAGAGAAVMDIAQSLEPQREMDPGARMTRVTREIYGGYRRSYGNIQAGTQPPYIANREFYTQADVDILYEDPGDHRNHFLYLHGLWHNGPESVTHARQTEGYEDYVAIMYYATTVNVVMSPEEGEPYQVRVTMDGRALEPTEAGSDIQFDEDGNSYVLVDEPKMYRVVKAPFPMFGGSGYELRLSSNSADFSVFAYTFGGFKN